MRAQREMNILAPFRGRVIASPQAMPALIGILLIVPAAFGFHLFSKNLKHGLTSAKKVQANVLAGSEMATRVLAQGPDLQEISVVHHGRIIEVKGGTEPGAVVMINGKPAATLFDGNKFKHFVGPLLPGTSIVTITAQNDRGGVTTRQLAVTIE